jgi:predicted TIM-barrel fold metal-dependent hydrolase
MNQPSAAPIRARLALVPILLLAIGAVTPSPGVAQPADRYEGPIIDVHLHAYTDGDYWGAVPNPATGDPAPATAEEHRTKTLEAMDEHGVVLGAVSGSVLEAAETWAERAPDRFLTGIAPYDPTSDLDVETFVDWVREGRLDVFAEIGAQYGGYAPSDPAFDPYWSVAEVHGIPVGIHTGESFPGTSYDACCPDFRLRLGDPLLLMHLYPGVHAEIGVLGHMPEHRATATLERFLELTEEEIDRHHAM